jgi:hypothetical protein
MDLLPPGYETLEPYLDTWILADSRARAEKRVSTAYSDIKEFYDAMLPLAPQALCYLADYQLGALDQAQERLLKLLLSLAEIGPAVEWYRQPTVVDGLDARRFPLKEQISDTLAQERR